jgi:hypothetical protein
MFTIGARKRSFTGASHYVFPFDCKAQQTQKDLRDDILRSGVPASQRPPPTYYSVPATAVKVYSVFGCT